ncbi:MAG TPA: mechanosensitive ion channel family protein [Candidatus Woesearchaeota archaeon]|nr:mechanosensitive ion channel family protein [Candidatus Woesearchaeota archaeon]
MSLLAWLNSPFKAYFLPIFIGVTTIISGNIANYLLKRSFRSAEHALEKHLKKHGGQYKERLAADRTKFVFMRRIVVIVIYVVGAILIISNIPSLKSFSYSLLAGAGVLAIIIGFATQKTLSNLVAGLMISISQPFRVGDRVKLKDEYGIIEDITLRHTVLKTWDNRRVIIPNSVINEEVINNYTFGDERILSTVEIGISYDSDIDLAKKIMSEEIRKHPLFIDNRTEADLLAGKDSVKVRVVGCDDFSIRLRGYYWTPNQPASLISRYELIESIKKRFDREGVEIPFPYRTIVYKKDMKKPKRVGKRKRKGA